jgi:hypothetical protein
MMLDAIANAQGDADKAHLDTVRLDERTKAERIRVDGMFENIKGEIGSTLDAKIADRVRAWKEDMDRRVGEMSNSIAERVRAQEVPGTDPRIENMVKDLSRLNLEVRALMEGSAGGATTLERTKDELNGRIASSAAEMGDAIRHLNELIGGMKIEFESRIEALGSNIAKQQSQIEAVKNDLQDATNELESNTMNSTNTRINSGAENQGRDSESVSSVAQDEDISSQIIELQTSHDVDIRRIEGQLLDFENKINALNESLQQSRPNASLQTPETIDDITRRVLQNPNIATLIQQAIDRSLSTLQLNQPQIQQPLPPPPQALQLVPQLPQPVVNTAQPATTDRQAIDDLTRRIEALEALLQAADGAGGMGGGAFPSTDALQVPQDGRFGTAPPQSP